MAVREQVMTEPRSDSDLPHIPVLRAGVPYTSLDVAEVRGYRGGEPMARVSQANPGILRRDLRKMRNQASVLRQVPRSTDVRDLQRGRRPLHGSRASAEPDAGLTQSADEYVQSLSSTSGMPHALVRKNMRKILSVFDDMPKILRGSDARHGSRGSRYVVWQPRWTSRCSTARTPDALGVMLPSNSPAVNSIWLPAIAMKMPVVLKPGREEPWTPMRLIQAFLKAGCPKEAFGFYPTTHEGSAAILDACGRSMLFGDEKVTAAYAHDPRVEVHGPGRSKVVIGEDEIDNWQQHLDVLVASVADNGGRSCINASSIFVPAHGREIAEALARAVAEIRPVPAADESARLSAFANPKFAEFIDAAVNAGLAEPGADDVTASVRGEERLLTVDDSRYLLPTIVRCDSVEHTLARTEYMFPFASVVEVPQDEMVDALGPTLVVTAITKDAGLIDELVTKHRIDRINLGPVPTSRVEWDQPHEGNLFEFLYSRRAIQRAEGW